MIGIGYRLWSARHKETTSGRIHPLLNIGLEYIFKQVQREVSEKGKRIKTNKNKIPANEAGQKGKIKRPQWGRAETKADDEVGYKICLEKPPYRRGSVDE